MRAGLPFGDARDRHLAGLGERDRRLAYELSAGVLRRQATLDRALGLGRADPRLHDILRLGAYQLRCLGRVPAHAAVATAVELARDAGGEKAAGYVNRVLRDFARDAGSGTRDTAGTHPRWLVERWRQHFGRDEAARLVAWNDAKPAVILQPARWDARALGERLQEAGLRVEEAPYGAGIRLAKENDASRIPPPAQLPGYAEGAFLVQDPAHALVCRYAALPRGARAYDACGAPGGKAVVLETLGARVVTGDARRERLPRLVDTVRRCGMAIRVVLADLLAAPFAPETCDALVVDAPCTATGTMARHPDSRWRITAGAIRRAAERQRRLLDAAARLVRRGGVLVYATCSLEPEENAAVVDDFLSRHPDFGRAPVPGAAPSELVTPAGDFESRPPRHGTDGAYAARLARRT